MVKLFRFQRGGAVDTAHAAAEAELAAVMADATAPTRRSLLGRLGGLLARGDAVPEQAWEDLEEGLIAADVGATTAVALLERVRRRAEEKRDARPDALRELLRDELLALLSGPGERAAGGRLWNGGAEQPPPPQVVLVVGVNGSGKTTTIAKLARAYGREGRSVILAAADTFRAAAIDQLQHWGESVGAPVIAHQPGADPGAVAYDALEAARARGADLVIVDTAGRLQTKKNLMAELSKIRRVLAGRVEGAPHEVLLVMDAGTGRNGLSQARLFAEAADVTAICLAKLDGTSKGGVVFAIAAELGIPVRFVGTGERPADLAPFDPKAFVDALLLEGNG